MLDSNSSIIFILRAYITIITRDSLVVTSIIKFKKLENIILPYYIYYIKVI